MLAANRKSVIDAVQTVLSADLSCSKADFQTEGVTIHKAEIREGRFRFPVREQSLSIVTMGKGAVISCSADRMEWAQKHLGSLTRDQLFSVHTLSKIESLVKQDGQLLAGPDQKYVCSVNDAADFAIPEGITISVQDRSTIAGLYTHTAFPHALSFNPNSPRPDRLAAVAEYGGIIVGIAGASEDCELMWQIGVDVLPEFQSRGIGKALVGKLTRALFHEGIVPYYSASLSNMQSRQLAVSLGYWPAWIQIYAR